MANSEIILGDEIEDITAKVRGICVGRAEYLDGARSYFLQPPYDDNGNRVNLVEVQESYAIKVGDGIRVEPKQSAGFRVSEINNA